MKHVLRLLVVLAMWVPLSACGSLLPGLEGPSNLYNLSPKSSFRQDLPVVEWQLVIEESLASGGLNSASIAYKPNPLEIRYFKDVRWTERVPRMVQTLLVESFENSGTIVSVGRRAIGLRADYSLLTEIREFQSEDMGGGNIRVRVNAKLVRQPRQVIVQSQSFETIVPDRSKQMVGTIQAWDEALGRTLKQIVEWTVIHGENDYRLRQQQRRQ
jgi:cholesterol transport system auxiliary component